MRRLKCLSELSMEHKRVLLAEKVGGWTQSALGTWFAKGAGHSTPEGVPQYYGDERAIRDLVRGLPPEAKGKILYHLSNITDVMFPWNATAPELCEAVGKAFNLW